MSYSRLKLAAFTTGALAVCLSAAAETPGLEHIGCCGAGDWAQPADATPLSDGGETRGSYIQRSRTKGDWSLHIAGMSTPPVALPAAVDRALRHALGGGASPGETPAETPARATYGEDVSYDETVTRWSVGDLLGAGGSEGGAWPLVRNCRDHDEVWCRRHRPPPPPPAAPEPGAWTLLVTGVAAIGAALRWKRRSATGATRSA